MGGAMRRGNRIGRLSYLCLAYGCVGLGAAGAVLPLLPTTPFLLAAAWAAPKGSPTLDRWLREHSRFGPVLRNWEEHRAVSRRAKVTACLLLLASWVILLATADSPIVPVVTGALFLAVGTFVCTRSEPRYEQGAGVEQRLRRARDENGKSLTRARRAH